MKSKVDKLDVDKLVPVPVDLSKLSDIVKNDVVKKDGYNAYGLKLIRSITKNSDDYDVKHMNIKFDSDDDLHLNKTIEIPIVTIVIRAVFHENNKYYTQVFLDECLYKILKCYIMIELAFMKLIKQVHQNSVTFVTIGISWIIVWSFNQMFAIDVMIY